MSALKGALKVTFGILLMLAVVLGTGWVIYAGATEAPGVMAAVVAALGALAGLFVQRHLEQQREEERHRRERMAPIYEQLVGTFYKGTADSSIDEDELQAFFAELAQRLLIWGKPSILKAWIGWRLAVTDIEEGSADSLLTFERFIFAMRADLGHDDKELVRGDLLRVFINDIDDHLEHPAT